MANTFAKILFASSRVIGLNVVLPVHVFLQQHCHSMAHNTGNFFILLPIVVDICQEIAEQAWHMKIMPKRQTVPPQKLLLCRPSLCPVDL